MQFNRLIFKKFNHICGFNLVHKALNMETGFFPIIY